MYNATGLVLPMPGDELDMRVLGARLCQLREARRLPLSLVAETAGMFPGRLRDIEKGKFAGLSIHTLWRLCVTLQVAPNTLLGWVEGISTAAP